MSGSQQAAAPTSGTITFAELAADPEIATLLDFTLVARSHPKANGWTPDMQRMFIGWLAQRHRQGLQVPRRRRIPGGLGARHSACRTAARRRHHRAFRRRRAMRAPTVSRAKPQLDEGLRDDRGRLPLPGQVMNEVGEWED